MSNSLYKGEMFNPLAKEQFLSEYSDRTRNTLSRVFYVSFSLENDLQKDLYDFTREEIRRLGFLFRPTTKNSSRQNISGIEKYIAWAIEKGHRKNSISPLDGITKEWKEQFANENLTKLWHIDDIQKIIKTRKNAQDAAIVKLLFMGVKGKNNTEITNLRRVDVLDKENTLIVFEGTGNKKMSRRIVVDEQCIELCLKAYSETIYEKSNGEPDPDTKNPVVNLVDNEYIIKSSITRTEHYDSAEMNIVYRRMKIIRKEINEPLFNPRNIVNSGALYEAYKIYKNRGKFDRPEMDEVCTKYNIARIDKNGLMTNRAILETEFLNLETIKKVYGD